MTHSQAAIKWADKSIAELGTAETVETLTVMLRLAFEAGRLYERELAPRREDRHG